MKQAGSIMITVLVFSVVAITVLSGAVVVSVINTQGTSDYSQAERLLAISEAGVENAALLMLRDPSYSGNNLSVGNDTVTISVSGTNPLTIESVVQNTDFTRRIQSVMERVGGVLNVTSWDEL
ncbi:hypothetical protein H6804_02080 [Candidatus Nomurabacteria bacterium]|uniref:Uncharacterized protein n=1 Tax=candidate division WWE3 bacterium TaxID=2053526 RepID=A0A955E1R7_UNCKA|nr:hypothetical protein [candidate division WWE3 bacterium]MCB9827044.1 hypothetical protein [Candidatus Nomurabacteria bacterium]HXK52877.1 hypothetical protein [bacterium]